MLLSCPAVSENSAEYEEMTSQSYSIMARPSWAKDQARGGRSTAACKCVALGLSLSLLRLRAGCRR